MTTEHSEDKLTELVVVAAFSAIINITNNTVTALSCVFVYVVQSMNF